MQSEGKILFSYAILIKTGDEKYNILNSEYIFKFFVCFVV